MSPDKKELVFWMIVVGLLSILGWELFLLLCEHASVSAGWR